MEEQSVQRCRTGAMIYCDNTWSLDVWMSGCFKLSGVEVKCNCGDVAVLTNPPSRSPQRRREEKSRKSPLQQKSLAMAFMAHGVMTRNKTRARYMSWLNSHKSSIEQHTIFAPFRAHSGVDFGPGTTAYCTSSVAHDYYYLAYIFTKYLQGT